MESSQSDLIRFYLGEQPDHRGRMISDIWGWDSVKLEAVHDYIQWLFPLVEKSAFNAEAPLLSEHEIENFKESKKLKERLRKSFVLLLSFYGLSFKREEGELEIMRSVNFEERSRNWLTAYNHNFLRITRILKCLCALGLESYASLLLKALECLYEDYEAVIGKTTLWYWRDAVRTSVN